VGKERGGDFKAIFGPFENDVELSRLSQPEFAQKIGLSLLNPISGKKNALIRLNPIFWKNWTSCDGSTRIVV